MIRLFKNTETDFTHNGIGVLDDILIGDSCILDNGINLTYSLEMEVAIFDNEKWKDIEVEMFLRVNCPEGEQIFRIKEVVQGFSTLKIYAKHVFFDLENNFILDTNVVSKDGRSALSQILGGMSNNTINTYYSNSNISLVRNSRLVRKNVVTALLGSDDNSFVNRWGGELALNNFNFAINTRIGQDRGFTIRYGKNCTGYEGNVNTYKLCTRIVPVGYNGIMLEGTKWVDSPNISKYPQIYTQEIKYDHIKVKEKPDDEDGYDTLEEAQGALREAALNTFINTKCDLPSFSATVNFITLENTVEYEDVRALERVELGDDVYIYLSNIGVTASSRVVKTRYNFFTKKYVEVEVGEVKPNFFKQLVTIKDTVDLVTEQLGGNTWQDIINKSLDEATKLMAEGLKDSHVITMKNQIIIGDAPEIENMVNCIVMNKNGIGFSNNGYLPDQLVSAMTIDGKINASCITTGQLNAALIKTGMLMSANGTTWIDMERGTFNFANKIKFDGTNFSVKLNNGKDVETELTTQAGLIANKVGTTEMNSAIQQKADEITSTVSSTYQTKSAMGSYSTTTQMNSAIQQKADSITSTASATYTTKTETGAIDTRLQSAEQKITPTAITSTISTQLKGNDKIQTTNMLFDKNGLTVTGGAIKVSNSNGDVVIDGSKYLFRLLSYGNGNIVLANGEQTKSVTITHNLGYSPMFRGQFRFANSGGTVETYIDSMNLYDWTDGTVRIHGRMWVTDTQLFITIWRSSAVASSGQQTYYYRYFIEDGVNL